MSKTTAAPAGIGHNQPPPEPKPTPIVPTPAQTAVDAMSTVLWAGMEGVTVHFSGDLKLTAETLRETNTKFILSIEEEFGAAIALQFLRGLMKGHRDLAKKLGGETA